MKQYAYYPGCSLESLAKSYHKSALETSRELGMELMELEDWNCCGATAYFPVDEFLAYTLVSRNLAIAEKTGLDFVAPCSGCYKNAYFTNNYLRQDADLAEHINFALAEDNLHVNGTGTVRHLLDVFIEDVGLEEIKSKVSEALKGLHVAPYYGCQMVRPRKKPIGKTGEARETISHGPAKGNPDENIENPQYFEELLSAIGAEPVEFPSKVRCCGGSLIITNRKAALDMIHILLQDATEHGADVIATACPMCNINLEVYQSHVNQEFGTKFSIPIVYFTQLMGLALGIAPGRLGIGRDIITALKNTKRERSL